MIPDWQLPLGVDRGLWDYLHATEMVASYDDQMKTSPLASIDIAFCERAFPTPGKLLDLGCGTGRLCAHFTVKGFDCVGVDLSEAMLTQARLNAPHAEFVRANLTELDELPTGTFDYAACLFSTLGMVRGVANRTKVIDNAFRLLKPSGRLVLHAHNRYFRGLGCSRVLWQRWKTLMARQDAGDVTMTQAYAGAPLTLHHFTRSGMMKLLTQAGFEIATLEAFGIDGNHATGSRVYGWLACGKRE